MDKKDCELNEVAIWNTSIWDYHKIMLHKPQADRRDFPSKPLFNMTVFTL